MDCDDCLQKLYAFLDQELESSDRTQVAKHLEGCTDCGDNLAFEERFLKVIRDCGTSADRLNSFRSHLLTCVT